MRRVACPNVYLGSHHYGDAFRSAHEEAVDVETKIDDVFGTSPLDMAVCRVC